MLRNPDHVTVAVADAATAIEFFALLGFRKKHVATIDAGVPAQYMGMPDMKAQHITLALEGSEPRDLVARVRANARRRSGPAADELAAARLQPPAFRVDDIEAATTHLQANGVQLLSDEMDYISRRLRLFERPEGIALELVPWVDSPSDRSTGPKSG